MILPPASPDLFNNCPRATAPEVLMDTATGSVMEQGVIAPEADAAHVTVTGTILPGTSPGTTVSKVIVAVHGVGDQYRYATIQSVVNQFCGFNNHPAAIPLGNFHTGTGTFTLNPPYPADPYNRFAFAEVYWAEIPRALVDDRHKLEETRRWARTIVERLRLRWHDKGQGAGYDDTDFDLLHQVLTEMIETIAVIDWLCFLAGKAGVFTFDIRKLLDDYLGDVQVVTEFNSERVRILDAFAQTMTAVHETFPSAEIHIVAHSEGTVVSFLGLLEAFRHPERAPWAAKVRGFMTLGSPIDTHLVLWPELFGETPPAFVPEPNERIEWRNYYDYGDPIGFALNDARAWIALRGWQGVFDFTDEPGHDNGFARYPFPGKAHVDYWEDKDLFGHFIETVLKENRPTGAGATGKRSAAPPEDRFARQLLTYVLPYIGVAMLLLVAAYVIFKAVVAAIDPTGSLFPTTLDVGRAVGGITALLVGVTVAARIPRLTRSIFWRSVGITTGLLMAALYLWSVQHAGPTERFGYEFPAGAITVLLAMLITALGAARPKWGLKPMIILGTLLATYKTAEYLLEARLSSEMGPIWPVFFAMAAFFYLWWLAALLFDLFFVWHHYIRHSKMIQKMDEIMGGSRETAPKARAPQVQ